MAAEAIPSRITVRKLSHTFFSSENANRYTNVNVSPGSYAHAHKYW